LSGFLEEVSTGGTGQGNSSSRRRLDPEKGRFNG
jgi:hypothetical protein